MNLLKKSLFLKLCIIVFAGSTNVLNAQQSYESNVVKVNVTAIAFRNFQVQYERMVTPRISVALAGRFMPEGKIPMIGVAENFIDNATAFRDLQNLDVKGTSIQPEVRFYLSRSKEGPRGLYLAPYMTISNYPVKYKDFVFEVEETVGGVTYQDSKTANLDGKVRGISGGLMLGAQWKLGKLLSLDWWIVGASYGSSKGNLNASLDEELSPEWQEALRERLEELEIPRIKMETEVYDRGVRSTLSGPWANLRTGLSLGVRF